MTKFRSDYELQTDSMASSEFFGEIYRKISRVHCTYMKVSWNITGIFVEHPSGHWRWGFVARTVSNEKVFSLLSAFYSSPPGQNGRHFADDIFRCIFMNEKLHILIEISLKFTHKGPIDNNPALVYIMAWRRIGDKPLSEPMLKDSLTHICDTKGRWVKTHLSI